ncbi:flagellar basal body-associated FliL family protein [Kineosporia sp. J2-2]|uniref:Flagellar protein FliL n=1 Tax=Kineosporia corallincola TaxID=2835133 RepID=A0ABS5TM07_9ACTN|nr:flagellar basal body-associated FliL family protein [Kineosporia corallincola]MBT0771404.1 flagellar basal body-associated FliL family protein [Kineosporia corallincola]
MAKDDDKGEDDEKGGGKKKLIIIALPVVVLVLAAAWFFVLRPKEDASGAAAELPAPTPGTVVALDPVTVNLSGSHYLQVAIALQPTADATETDGSKAYNEIINVFSGMTIDELSKAEGKDAAKKELVARIKLAYLPEGELTEEEIQKANEEVSGGKVKETEDLTAAQAEKRASELTVQPEVYDIYFTTFVMQ